MGRLASFRHPWVTGRHSESSVSMDACIYAYTSLSNVMRYETRHSYKVGVHTTDFFVFRTLTEQPPCRDVSISFQRREILQTPDDICWNNLRQFIYISVLRL